MIPGILCADEFLDLFQGTPDPSLANQLASFFTSFLGFTYFTPTFHPLPDLIS